MSLDILISQNILTLQTPILNTIMKLITSLADEVTIGIITISILTRLYYKKEKTKFYFYLVNIVSVTILIHFFKLLIARERPVTQLVTELSYSFPSGHTTMATVISLALYLLFKENLVRNYSQKLIISILIAYPLLIGISRIYLNVHWFTDIIAGFIVGTSLVFINFHIFKFYFPANFK